MLKLTQDYIDYDGNPQTEELHFHLTKDKMIDLLDIQPRLEAWQEKISGPERELTTDEIRELLDIVKILIKKSYGIRIGPRFIDTDEVYTEFTQTAVYDAFLFGLFDPPTRAMDFMSGIVPADLAKQAAESVGNTEQLVELPQPSTDESDTRPAWLREGRQPTKIELANMSKEELQLAFQFKASSGQ
jgi:hypothetical protein